MGEYQKPNHTISKNIKTLIISRAEKNIFPLPNMPLCKQKLRPVGETSEIKIVSYAYEHCKCLALELIHFMRGAADFKIQVIVQLRNSLPLLFEGWMTIPSLEKMHARLNLLLWCKVFNLNFQKRCKSTLSILFFPPFVHHLKTLDVLFLSTWMTALARSLLRYLSNVFSSTETTVCPSTEDIVVALYCKYISRGVKSLKCLWSV